MSTDDTPTSTRLEERWVNRLPTRVRVGRLMHLLDIIEEGGPRRRLMDARATARALRQECHALRAERDRAQAKVAVLERHNRAAVACLDPSPQLLKDLDQLTDDRMELQRLREAVEMIHAMSDRCPTS